MALSNMFTVLTSMVLFADKSFQTVLPKFDRVAAALCIYFWFTMQSIGTNIEV